MRYYKSIKLFRILSVLGVFLVHFYQNVGSTWNSWIKSVAEFGKYGLIIFFIISGFLGYAECESLRDFAGIKYYYKKRIARMLPAYYFMLIIFVIWHEFLIQDVPQDVWGLGWGRYFLCLNSILPVDGVIFWRGIHAIWSVSAMMVFYLIIPLVAQVMKKHPYIIMFLLYMISLLSMIYQKRSNPYYWLEWIGFLQFFVLGMSIKVASEKKCEKTMGIIYVLFALFSSIFGGIGYELYGCLFAVMMLLSLDLKFDKIADCKIIDILDEYSYAIFLTHPFVIDIGRYICGEYANSAVIFAIYICIGTVLSSTFLYICIEKPARAFLLGKRTKEKVV